MTEMEFFDGLDLRKFYTIVRSGSLEQAIRMAVRREDGFEAEVEDAPAGLRVRIRSPWGAEEFEIPHGTLPRAWTWWEPPPRRRSWLMVEADEEGLQVWEGPFLGPDEVYCDTCGTLTPLRLRPIPVLFGNAVCPRCFTIITGLDLEEAARMDGVALWEVREAQT
jgi:hypothetical protein